MKLKGRFAEMWKGKEGYKLKIEEIRLSPELLRINSRNTGGAGLAKILIILFAILPLLFYKDIVHIIKDKEPDQQLILISMVILFSAAFVFALYKMNQNSGKILIMTEKGFFIDPLIAGFWKDIHEYKWNSYNDSKGVCFPGQSAEISLMLIDNKGTWPKTYDLMNYYIFFNPDQMQQVDNLLNRFGIKKLEG